MQRTVRLAHDSFRDFVKTAECLEDFRIDDNYTHALIAAACLRYLSSVTIAPHDEIYNPDKRKAALSKGTRFLAMQLDMFRITSMKFSILGVYRRFCYVQFGNSSVTRDFSDG